MSPMEGFDAMEEGVDAAFGDGPPPGDPMGPPPRGGIWDHLQR